MTSEASTPRFGLFSHSEATDRLETALGDLIGVAAELPPDAAITTCPGWSATDLWAHLGGIHRWAATLVDQRRTEPLSRRSLDLELPDDGQWAAWLDIGGRQLVDALRRVEPAEAVWTWSGDDRAGWWARRTLHESVIHLADGSLAIGDEFEVDPLVAVDGIAELLTNTIARLDMGATVAPGTDASIHLHATDDPTAASRDDVTFGDHGEFMIEVRDGTLSWHHDHGKGDVAMRGSASELMLVLNGRRSIDDAPVEVFGDAQHLRDLLTTARL